PGDSGCSFAAAYEMRNVLAHGYFKVDLQAVWLTVKRDLPAIAAQITPLLAALRQQEGAEPTA
ncbi:HepT-like ribonuclease domain-containing protein, partial [Acinetobacter baumannii]